jgi:hypothetical protein
LGFDTQIEELHLIVAQFQCGARACHWIFDGILLLSRIRLRADCQPVQMARARFEGTCEKNRHDRPTMSMLQKANEPENRARQPWIVTMAHKPMYCSNNNDDECLYADGYIFVSAVFSTVEAMGRDRHINLFLIRRSVSAFPSFKPTASRHCSPSTVSTWSSGRMNIATNECGPCTIEQ